jgi:starvation-inducible DNA-binding protein
MAINKIPDEMNNYNRNQVQYSQQPMVQSENVEALVRVLADSYTLYLKTQYYHWNVAGEQFYSLHLLFEKQYTSLAKAVDKIAERIRALGEEAPGTYRALQSLTCLHEDQMLPPTWQHMVQNLIADHEHLITCSYNAMDSAEDANDKVTQDLLIERANAHEKNRWMLASLLK